jgi:hypothetical protein
MLAFNCAWLTNVVVRGLPFQCTTEPETNAEPLTVSVKAAPPGLAAPGTSGWLIRGIGFTVLEARLFTASTVTCGSCAALPTVVAIAANKVILHIKARVLDFMVSPSRIWSARSCSGEFAEALIEISARVSRFQQ